MDRAWYESFFGGVVLDFWEQAAGPDATRAEVDFLLTRLALQPGARVLDVACGLGRHAVELAGRGFRVTGIDLSDEALSRAAEAGKRAGVSVEWRRTEMRELPWEGAFDAVYCLGNSFGYLDPAGTRDLARAVARVLKPGGRWALDYGTAAETVLARLREREWLRVGDILFLEENKYHVAESCIETAYTFLRAGQSVRHTGFQWVYTVREIRDMLADAGMTVTDLFGSLAGEPFGLTGTILLAVAQKRD